MLAHHDVRRLANTRMFSGGCSGELTLNRSNDRWILRVHRGSSGQSDPTVIDSDCTGGGAVTSSQNVLRASRFCCSSRLASLSTCFETSLRRCPSSGPGRIGRAAITSVTSDSDAPDRHDPTNSLTAVRQSKLAESAFVECIWSVGSTRVTLCFAASVACSSSTTSASRVSSRDWLVPRGP